ncbi:hypothetical protein Curi_c18480 [Gottschalkia acidurici 9a]|uniref:DUF2975 domain-containing protein n=1 Tax=Gottschalkia acidurici (strain ATCC 7906 / DSM 604 / BCRC 14475 / CIP 104303 / KCTC 5404 / NCIMB 10678 / 9a) TaxID=1128398 RepID=K0AZZ6_GOTA9|nr:DUF2975 domain-containing protein [Gottschalkia acidurici]AFS78854.1 hypothetical protein Curi_c18480 [Gottschalkia acidurici 9a]
MQSEIKKRKIKKSVKIIGTIVRAITVVGYIGIIACLLTAISAIFKPTFIFNTMYLDEVLIQNSIDPDIFTRKLAVSLMIKYIMNIVFVILILKSLGRILSTIENGEPFDSRNHSEISIIGWITIASVNLIPILEYFVRTIILKLPSNLKGIGSDGVLRYYSTSVDWKITLLGIFLGVLIIILAQVFKYGTYLQNEYDSTL